MDIREIESIRELGKIETEKIEVNLIKFVDEPGKVVDVRRWKTNTNGHKEPLEGISLTMAEFEELKATLETITTE